VQLLNPVKQKKDNYQIEKLRRILRILITQTLENLKKIILMKDSIRLKKPLSVRLANVFTLILF